MQEILRADYERQRQDMLDEKNRLEYEEKLREMNFSGEFHVLLSEKTEQEFLFRTWQEAVGDYE